MKNKTCFELDPGDFRVLLFFSCTVAFSSNLVPVFKEWGEKEGLCTILIVILNVYYGFDGIILTHLKWRPRKVKSEIIQLVSGRAEFTFRLSGDRGCVQPLPLEAGKV